MKKLVEILRSNGAHWVGDGFPVRSLFSYGADPQAVSPFLLFDYAGPYQFEPATEPRGVGRHPHRGFETVTIVYEGEVSHKDSTGSGGTIGPGDVQWMTAAGGIIHEEFHSPEFTAAGGPFRMAQLWVNLPSSEKMSPPGYQAIVDTNIPAIELAAGQGRARVIAGDLDGVRGPARTFTPINMWDVRLDAGAELSLPVPSGHNTLVAVLSGEVTIEGSHVTEAEVARLSAEGDGVTIHSEESSILLVLTGEPIDEPVAGYGPFVMNNDSEIRQAIDDFNAGRFARVMA
ncbi:MAG TPA: pirin family protein [Sphingomicrobium sp.]|nr:pirin family protein [Sphingomicrobium sp.]